MLFSSVMRCKAESIRYLGPRRWRAKHLKRIANEIENFLLPRRQLDHVHKLFLVMLYFYTVHVTRSRGSKNRPHSVVCVGDTITATTVATTGASQIDGVMKADSHSMTACIPDIFVSRWHLHFQMGANHKRQLSRWVAWNSVPSRFHFPRRKIAPTTHLVKGRLTVQDSSATTIE